MDVDVTTVGAFFVSLLLGCRVDGADVYSFYWSCDAK